jgi:hypothetical protein
MQYIGAESSDAKSGATFKTLLPNIYGLQ